MTPNQLPVRTGMARLAALLLAVAATAVAPAQSLPDLLPADVAGAVGVHGLAEEAERLEPFLEEAERLGLFESLGAAIPDDAAADAEAPDVPAALADVEPMDLVGEEAWLAVSVSAFQPFPAVTLIARPADAAADAFRTAIEDAADAPGVSSLDEGGRTFWTYRPPAGEPGADLGVPAAYAQTEEGVLIASTDPEVVRFALRALDGADEPSMADGELYAALGDLGDGVAYGLLDAEPLTRSLEPLAAGFEAGPILARLQGALRTAGPSLGVVRVTDAGVESASELRPDAEGPDPALYDLLVEGTTAAPDAVLPFVPEDGVMVAASTFDAAGWWAWLDDVLASAAELGLPTATEAAAMFEVDPNALLFDWTGDDVVQITPEPTVPAEAGVPQEGLGAGGAILIEATDEAAARQGLDRLLSTVGPMAASFASPQGGAMAMPETVQVAGHDVQRLTINESIGVDAAVVDGWALLSFVPATTEAVLGAYADGAGAPAAFADAAADLPAPLRAWSISDDRAAVAETRDLLVSQLQTFAGFGGASELDFEAVDEAGADLAAFLDFVAERLGVSTTTTRVEDGIVRTEGFAPVDW